MDMSLSKLQDLVMDKEAWHTTVHGVTKIRTRLSNWTECFWDRKEGAQLLTEWGGGTDIKKNRIPQKLSETSYNQNGIEHGLVTDL